MFEESGYSKLGAALILFLLTDNLEITFLFTLKIFLLSFANIIKKLFTSEITPFLLFDLRRFRFPVTLNQLLPLLINKKSAFYIGIQLNAISTANFPLHLPLRCCDFTFFTFCFCRAKYYM